MAVGFIDLFVLLVEPSAAQAKFISACLEQLGVVNIRHVKSGIEAFSALEAAPFDLTITSMHLPDMTGVDLVIRISRDEGLGRSAFMVISSETNYRYLEPIRQAGAVAILPKPFTTEQLKRALHATLDHLAPDNSQLSAEDLDFLRVLLVDDSVTCRRVMRRVLENLGLRNFTEATNGREAIELLEGGLFDLVVTDYNMPELDGKGLVEYIRTSSTQSSIPVLMVTSETDNGRLAAVQQAGVSAMCDKPFEPEVVRTVLERILRDSY